MPKKIRRILKFNQKAFMRSYIDLNVIQINKPNITAFEKDFFKLINNSVFDKAIENVRQYQTVKICTNNEQFTKKIVPNIYNDHSIIIFENLVIWKMKSRKVVFSKPIYVGTTVLDISKFHMYKFHYDLILKTYGNNATFFNDTDSVMYQIFTSEFIKV